MDQIYSMIRIRVQLVVASVIRPRIIIAWADRTN